MELSELLRPDLVRIGLDAESKREAIGELVDLLVQQHEIAMAERDNVLELILHREKTVSSGMEGGIAVPHAATDKVEDIICALGTSARGIPFDSSDGSPARIVVLLLVPKRNFSGEVRALAGIQRLLATPGLRAQILDAKDPKNLYDLIDIQEHAK